MQRGEDEFIELKIEEEAATEESDNFSAQEQIIVDTLQRLMPLTIPLDLRKKFFNHLMNRINWPIEILKYEHFTNLDTVKAQYVELIKTPHIGLSDSQRFNLAVQALCRCTGIGGVMYISQGNFSSASLRSGKLKKIIDFVEALPSFYTLTDSTQQAVVEQAKSDPNFLELLKISYTKLYNFLTQTPLLKNYLKEKAQNEELQKNKSEDEFKKQKIANKQATIYREILSKKRQEFVELYNASGLKINFQDYLQDCCEKSWKEHNEKLKQAIHAMSESNINTAIANLIIANDRYKQNPIVHARLAICSSARANYSDAYSHFQQALKCAETYEPFIREFIELCLANKSYRLAHHAYALIEKSLTEREALIASEIALQLGMCVAAEKYCMRSVDIPELQLKKSYYLSDLKATQGKTAEALVGLQFTLNMCAAMLKNSPDNLITALYYKTLLMLGQNSPLEKALDYYAQATPYISLNAEVEVLKGCAFLANKDEANAQKCFSNVCSNENAEPHWKIFSMARMTLMLSNQTNPQFTQQLTNYLKNFPPSEVMNVEDTCIYALAHAALNNVDEVKKLLRNSAIAPQTMLFGELPIYLRVSYLNLILNNKYTTDNDLLLNTDMEMLKEIKEQYVNYFALTNNINLGLQAICPHTLLGRVFNIARGSLITTLDSGSLYSMVVALNKVLCPDQKVDVKLVRLYVSTTKAMLHEFNNNSIFNHALKTYSHVYNFFMLCQSKQQGKTAKLFALPPAINKGRPLVRESDLEIQNNRI